MILKLTNNVTKQEYTWEVNDEGKSGMYWTFEIILPEGITDGEYSYELYDDVQKIASGLCQIGEYVEQKKTYQNNEKKTITYNG